MRDPDTIEALILIALPQRVPAGELPAAISLTKLRARCQAFFPTEDRFRDEVDGLVRRGFIEKVNVGPAHGNIGYALTALGDARRERRLKEQQEGKLFSHA